MSWEDCLLPAALNLRAQIVQATLHDDIRDVFAFLCCDEAVVYEYVEDRDDKGVLAFLHDLCFPRHVQIFALVAFSLNSFHTTRRLRVSTSCTPHLTKRSFAQLRATGDIVCSMELFQPSRVGAGVCSVCHRRQAPT